jgi:hypothetical protein
VQSRKSPHPERTTEVVGKATSQRKPPLAAGPGGHGSHAAARAQQLERSSCRTEVGRPLWLCVVHVDSERAEGAGPVGPLVGPGAPNLRRRPRYSGKILVKYWSNIRRYSSRLGEPCDGVAPWHRVTIHRPPAGPPTPQLEDRRDRRDRLKIAGSFYRNTEQTCLSTSELLLLQKGPCRNSLAGSSARTSSLQGICHRRARYDEIYNFKFAGHRHCPMGGETRGQGRGCCATVTAGGSNLNVRNAGATGGTRVGSNSKT